LAKAATGKIKVIAIIASLAALALVLSPTFSELSLPGGTRSPTTGASSLLQDEVIEEDNTVVEDVSAEDLASCTAINNRVDRILGVVDGEVNERKVASDTLLAEYCSRPVLIHEIAGTDHAPMSLVAYACDASSGRIGTAAMQDSLSDHALLYCDSARVLIANETNTFMQTVEQFRSEYLPLLELGQEETEDSPATDGDIDDDTNPAFNATAIDATLDEVALTLEDTLTLLDEGEYYAAAKSFDIASKKFIGMFQSFE
jgi:hypothetical protein